MKRKTIVIEIRPDRLDLVVPGGRDVEAKRERIDVHLSDDATQWRKDLRDCSDALRESVVRMGAEGAVATVFHTSPSLAVDLVSLPNTSASDALHAARMSCHDAVPYSFDVSIGDAAILMKDRGRDSARRHLVAAVEHNDSAVAIAEFLEGAALKVGWICPVSAPIIAWTTDLTMESSRGECRAVLYLGEHLAFFAAAENGRLLFGRQIRHGLDAMARALTQEIYRGAVRNASAAFGTTQPIESEDQSASRRPEREGPIRLDLDRAARLLMMHGIPDRDSIVDEEHRITGGQIMPLLQPVLQRLVVEVRQSLRFGLSDEQRRTISIILCGPGANLPGIGPLLEAELGLQITGSSKQTEYDPNRPGASGSDLDLAIRISPRAPVLTMLPRRMAAERTITGYRRWAWAGAAAALLSIGLETLGLNGRLNDARRTFSSLQMQASEQQSFDDARTRLLQFRTAQQTLERDIAEHMHGAQAPGAILREIARQTPGGIDLNSIAISHTPKQTTCGLTGLALTNEEGELTGRYFNALRLSPLFDTVDLRSVQRTEVRGRAGERFDVRLNCIVWPWNMNERERDAPADGEEFALTQAASESSP